MAWRNYRDAQEIKITKNLFRPDICAVAVVEKNLGEILAQQET